MFAIFSRSSSPLPESPSSSPFSSSTLSAVLDLVVVGAALELTVKLGAPAVDGLAPLLLLLPVVGVGGVAVVARLRVPEVDPSAAPSHRLPSPALCGPRQWSVQVVRAPTVLPFTLPVVSRALLLALPLLLHKAALVVAAPPFALWLLAALLPRLVQTVLALVVRRVPALDGAFAPSAPVVQTDAALLVAQLRPPSPPPLIAASGAPAKPKMRSG